MEKSDVPTTIILPKPHPQIGRPPKKRKKSTAELADEIIKSNKMTRPHRQHRLQLEEDARVKKVDMLVLVHKGGRDAGVGGSQTTQTTQSSVGRAQHPSFLHASTTKMTKSSAKRGGP
ncbi:hypothetical protein Tco_0633798 [Tanacetum coccineum]